MDKDKPERRIAELEAERDAVAAEADRERDRLLAAAETNRQETAMWKDLAEQSIRALAELKAEISLAPLPKKSGAPGP